MDEQIPEIRMALFGASASGKTTFLASYFGNQQRSAFEKDHGYRIEAQDISDGNRLLSRYYGMENGTFPLGTGLFSEYRFWFKVTGLTKQALGIVWYDYPGGWWEQTPRDDSERKARKEALSKLLMSHVGVLLIDASRYTTEGLSYVRALLDQFRNEVRRISDEFATDGAPIEIWPSQWIIAISKADLLPAYTTAQDVCKHLVIGASEQLAGVAKAVNSKSFGSQFLLLSSVRGQAARVTDAHAYVGLELIAPVALLSVLSELAKKASKGTGYGVLGVVLERLSAVVDLIDRIDDFLPVKYQILTHLLKALQLRDGLGKGADYFRKKQQTAAKKGKALSAVAAAFRAELASTEAATVYYKNQSNDSE